jgi:hypothetical protein
MADHWIHDPPCPNGGHTAVSPHVMSAGERCPLCGAALIPPSDVRRRREERARLADPRDGPHRQTAEGDTTVTAQDDLIRDGLADLAERLGPLRAYALHARQQERRRIADEILRTIGLIIIDEALLIAYLTRALKTRRRRLAILLAFCAGERWGYTPYRLKALR